MAKRHVDRSTLKILAARRVSRGVEVSATFEAPKTSGEVGSYRAQLIVDPNNRSIVSQHFYLFNRKGGALTFQSPRSKDTLRDLALDVGRRLHEDAGMEGAGRA